ncbi:hypothetical protein GGQ92_001946 [Gracilibacillus halotolerans]|uniref:YtzI protein n=1 Tax=Gracilibacillus halotolerans TaxID=74386 RepID=A0A841RP51_9BACI|nr:YtzI protein [Gracilibacillus halotolerans]MBB6513156.1 hypothetical protein [Gracilibacillus halotolerans]
MWIIFVVLILCSVIVAWLSIITLNKGYGYKQTIDPLPREENKKEQQASKNGKVNK